MIRLRHEKTFRYIKGIDHATGHWISCHQYYLYSDTDDMAEMRIDPGIKIRFPDMCLPQTDFDLSITYRPFFERKESYTDEHIENTFLADNAILIGKMFNMRIGLEHIENLFKTRQEGFRFEFTILMRETVVWEELERENLIKIDVEGDNRRQRVIISHNFADIEQILYYPYHLGNLEEEIIWDLKMFARTSSENWQIEIGTILQPFTIEEFRKTIEAGLRIQTEPVLKRVPAYLRRQYPESIGHPLDIVVTIDEMKPGIQYKIYFTLREPAQELYYRTNNPAIDKVIVHIHQRLIDLGVAIGQETELHQKVLSQLLLYRDACLSLQGYISAELAKKTETKGFHEHLHEKLHHNLSFGNSVNIISEPDIGNSRIDLLIEGIPTELKLEDRKTFTTPDIVNSYKEQAADYIARCNAPFGFLVVLDTVLNRKQPTSPVEQDVKIEQVTTSAGGTVIVIAVIVRIPRKASDFTTLAGKRKKK